MPETYAEYSLMTQRRAGQLWSGSQAASQWSWSPQTDGTSRIAWGIPSMWPPETYEVFRRDGDWVYMLGYASTSGDWLPQVITAEWIGDAAGNNMVPLPLDPAGRQHYVKWSIPTTGYSLRATGYMIWQGARIDFTHQQKWAPPVTLSNAYHAGKRCIRQAEVWTDNTGNPGGPLITKQDRDHYIAKGMGMGFKIMDRFARWNADLRHHWAW